MSNAVQISAAMVKELRELSQAGMMECKKALTQANGDMDLALENLRAAGMAKASKRSSAIAAEGLVVAITSADGRVATLVEVNCETDFVAREQSFKDFCIDVAQLVLSTNTTDLADLSNLMLGDLSVEATRLELVLKLGENISIRRAHRLAAPAGAVLAAYVHGGTDAARIGSVVCLQGSTDLNLAKDFAMHIAAMNPEFLSEVPAARLEEERVAVENDADKLQEFIDSAVLLNQTFFKNPNFTMKELLLNNSCSIVEFVRFEVGEGIEKKQTDFADEVKAAQQVGAK